jgi:hypothetical protein
MGGDELQAMAADLTAPAQSGAGGALRGAAGRPGAFDGRGARRRDLRAVLVESQVCIWNRRSRSASSSRRRGYPRSPTSLSIYPSPHAAPPCATSRCGCWTTAGSSTKSVCLNARSPKGRVPAPTGRTSGSSKSATR